MKLNTRLLLQTALLLALGIAVQFLQSVSVYAAETIVSLILVISVLTGGFLSAAVIAVIVPLFSWWITGSAPVNAHPVIVLFLILANLIQVGLVWVFGVWLRKKLPAAKTLSLSSHRFRQVLLIALAASTLWGAVTLAFLSSFASVLQITSITPALIMTLVMVVGVFLVFVCLWAVAARFPACWSPIVGIILSAVAKALFLWLIVDKLILTSAESEAYRIYFTVTPLLTALLGSLAAFLIWLPIKKHLEK